MTTTTTNFTSANALQKVAYYYNSDYSKITSFSAPLITVSFTLAQSSTVFAFARLSLASNMAGLLQIKLNGTAKATSPLFVVEDVSKTPSDYYVQPGTTYMHNTYAPSVCLGTVAAGTHSLTIGIQSLYTSGAAVVLNGSFGTAPIQADSEVSVYSFS